MYQSRTFTPPTTNFKDVEGRGVKKGRKERLFIPAYLAHRRAEGAEVEAVVGSTDQPRVLLKKILFILHKRYHVFSRSTGILLRRHPQYFCIPFLSILPLQKHTQTVEPSDEHHATARLRAQRGKRKEKCRSLSFPHGLPGRAVSLVAGASERVLHAGAQYRHAG